MTTAVAVESRAADIPIIDGHTDYLLSLRETGRDFLIESTVGHVDLPRALRGGLRAMFSAVYIPSDWLPEGALSYTINAIDQLNTIVQRSNGRVMLVRNVVDLQRCIQEGTFGAILHYEGAEAIDPDLCFLRLSYQLGLRSLGLTWSRPNIFAEGVGPLNRERGLTQLGRELVNECNRLGILLDVSHLNEAGFWDVLEYSQKPVVASHSNARALCPVERNLTDDQIRALYQKGGLIGINFHVGFLVEGATRPEDVSLHQLIDHIDYIVGLTSIETVALGSDFDGATMPSELADATKLPALIVALQQRGYDEAAIRKLCYENWLRVLGAVWAT